MGGRKKPTLSQLEKRMRKQLEAREKREKKRETTSVEPVISIERIDLNRVAAEVSKMPYVTPYLLASKYGIKISAARRILKQLVDQGVLSVYDYNRRVPIFVPAKTSPKGTS